MTIKEERYLTKMSVSTVCNDNHWYTHGTKAEFNEMVEPLGIDSPITTEILYEIAKNIVEHSDMNPAKKRYNILNVMSCLSDEVYSIFHFD